MATTTTATHAVDRRKSSPISTLERYAIGDKVGSGGCGVVYRAYDSITNEYVALKTASKAEFAHLIDIEAQLLNSISQLDVDVDFLVLPSATFSSNDACCLVFELFLTDLWEEMENYREKDELVPLLLVRRAGYCCLRALSSLHDNGYIHGDVKLDNMLLGHGLTVKLGDFGSMHRVSEPARSVTPAYGAPEQLRNSKVALPASDVWSLAVALATLVTFDLPFQGSTAAECLQSIQKSAGEGHRRLIQQLDEFDFDLGSLITSCLREDPSLRPSARQLLDHPLFDAIRDDYSSVPKSVALPDRFQIAAHRVFSATSQDTTSSDKRAPDMLQQYSYAKVTLPQDGCFARPEFTKETGSEEFEVACSWVSSVLEGSPESCVDTCSFVSHLSSVQYSEPSVASSYLHVPLAEPATCSGTLSAPSALYEVASNQMATAVQRVSAEIGEATVSGPIQLQVQGNRPGSRQAFYEWSSTDHQARTNNMDGSLYSAREESLVELPEGISSSEASSVDEHNINVTLPVAAELLQNIHRYWEDSMEDSQVGSTTDVLDTASIMSELAVKEVLLLEEAAGDTPLGTAVDSAKTTKGKHHLKVGWALRRVANCMKTRLMCCMG